MKTALLAASLVLVAGSAVACGGGGADGAPADASEKEFCDGYSSLFTDMVPSEGATEGPDEAAMLKSFKDWGNRMEEIGTPEDISDDARAGFELTVDQIDELEAKDLDDEGLEKLDDDLSKDETKQVDEFTTYLNDTCGNPLEEMAPTEPSS